jgi:alpha-tubulin suppressor-like RCC1 family protein
MMNGALSPDGANFWTGAGGKIWKAEVPNTSDPSVQVGVGGSPHFCSLHASGEVECAGDNEVGQVGDGTTTSPDHFVKPIGLGAETVAVTLGRAHTCALSTAGRLKCWGLNGNGQLGNATTSNSAEPVEVVGLPAAVRAVSAWYDHTCAVTGTGEVWCWGSNSDGQLGDSTNTDSSVPVKVTGLDAAATSVATGRWHTCAITDQGAVWCWGRNDYTQLGRIGDENLGQSLPVPVVQLSEGVVALAVGGLHTCALTSTGGVYCWGSNMASQLGMDDHGVLFANTPDPTVVKGLGSGVAAIAAGFLHTCALTIKGAVICWGAKTYDATWHAKAIYRSPEVVIKA